VGKGALAVPTMLPQALSAVVGSLRLVLLRHECDRLFDAALRPQHGHRGKVLASAMIRRTRMVAIEFGM